jgi:uroporphyrinogen-III synthase
MSARLPFHNLRVAITRAEAQGHETAAHFEALGAHVHLFPVIAVAPPADPTPLDDALVHLGSYDWLVFTSANAVHSVIERLQTRSCAIRQLCAWQIGAVGPATAAALAAYGIDEVLVAERHDALGLLAALGDVRGQRMLLPQSDIAHPTLADGLRAAGARVDTVIAYRTVAGPAADQLAQAVRHREIDILTLASPSAVQATVDALARAGLSRGEIARLGETLIVACIGPTTANAAQHHGLHVDVVPEQHTIAGLIDALTDFLAERKHQ